MVFAIVHFNTPELTTCLCSSIYKFYNNAKIIIFDNSDKKPLINYNLFNIQYYDNTKNQLINFDKEFQFYDIDTEVKNLNNCGSARHCRTIQWFIDNLIEDEFILLDSDILLTAPLDFIDKKFICCATVEHYPNMKIRFLPFITYFNLKMIKENNINYFSHDRINGLSKKGKPYDTGASFFEDIYNNHLLYNNINYTNYLVHFKNGSWSNKTYAGWLLKYKKYWL